MMKHHITFFTFLLFASYTIKSNEIKPKLSDFSYNKYSQFGEDGIIQKIFEIIGTTSKVCVEFGACNGFLLSNTANLWAHYGWKGVLIEADTKYLDALKANTAPYDCIAINTKVGIGEHDALESILYEHNIHESIDLLSIDIDGNDYHILQSLNTVRPRLIICEYNPTIPAILDVYTEYNNYFGCSVSALTRIARQKGYELIALTDTNAFFIVAEEFTKFSHFELSLDKIAVNNYLTYVVTSYGGEYAILSKQQKLPYGITRPYSKKLYLNCTQLQLKP